MKIISVSDYKGSTVRIKIENHGDIFMNGKLAAKNGISAGADFSENEFEKIIEADKKRKAREYALHLLAERDYGCGELYEKLKKCYKDEKLAAEIVARLKGSGLLDDEKFAAAKARYLFEVKQSGVYKAKFELKRLGISDELINTVIEPYIDCDSTRKRLEELVERKYERYLTGYSGVRKVKSALARLGYSFDDINAVIGLYDIPDEE